MAYTQNPICARHELCTQLDDCHQAYIFYRIKTMTHLSTPLTHHCLIKEHLLEKDRKGELSGVAGQRTPHGD